MRRKQKLLRSWGMIKMGNKKNSGLRARLPFILSLLGVFTLMGLYVWFIGGWLGNSSSPQEKYNSFMQYAESIRSDIETVSAYEITISADDKPHQILMTGENGESRKKLLQGAYVAETYISPVNGHRCARYYYEAYDLYFVIIYDKESASQHTDGSEFSAVLGDSITVAFQGNASE